MIPIPALVALGQKLVISKVIGEAKRTVPPLIVRHVVKLDRKEANVNTKPLLKGKKTYIGIMVLLCSALAPQLGISESEVSTIITALGTAAGGLIAIYGRIKANS